MKRPCPLCGAIQNLVKKWDKKPTGFGARAYWYESDHQCPKLANSRKIVEELQERMFR